MIISNYQVQSTLRAYSQQLAERTRLSKINPPKNTQTKDQVLISPESKKRIMAEKIANQIINQFTDGSELNETQREIVNRLSREYGYSIQIGSKEGQGLAFKVRDKESPKDRDLPPEESEKLKKKLLEITHEIVYNNLS